MTNDTQKLLKHYEKLDEFVSELRKVDDCAIGQDFNVPFRSVRGRSPAHHIIQGIDNPGYAPFLSDLANRVFRPHLEAALREYKQEIIAEMERRFGTK